MLLFDALHLSSGLLQLALLVFSSAVYHGALGLHDLVGSCLWGATISRAWEKESWNRATAALLSCELPRGGARKAD